METLHGCCAGLDVHKETLQATVRRLRGHQLWSQTRQFATTTRELLSLSDWLGQEGVTHVVMESTGVYWKPVYHVLEGSFQLLLVNAQHVKQVPGRKTDVKDSQWLAELLQYGLLRGSFIPPQPIRELRDLTRHRAQLVAEKTRVANRLQKTLEDANIKLGSVASDILGVSGQAMLEEMMAGESDPGKLAELAQGRLRRKLPELRDALWGTVTEHHRFLLRVLYDGLRHVESLIARMEKRIEQVAGPFEEALQRLDEVPGVNRCVAQVLVAEVGVDMKVFPSAQHLASWAGLCPGNHRSAGKQKTGKTTKGSRWLRQGLLQGAWAAAHTKGSYLGAQYRRLAQRRGKKRALVAVAHSILLIAYELLRNPQARYNELGRDYFERQDPERLARQLVQRLERLGHKVSLEPIAA